MMFFGQILENVFSTKLYSEFVNVIFVYLRLMIGKLEIKRKMTRICDDRKILIGEY